MAREATSAHLDSMIHVYNGGPLDGTTARLYVTPWDRNTVADGYWQTVNTIQPLINRDIYLADAIDKLAEKYTTYKEGFAISITPVSQDSDIQQISVVREDIFDSPSYNFDSNYFTCVDVDSNTKRIGMNLNAEGYITADSNGIYCNVDKMISSTSSYSSYSNLSGDRVSAFSYDYGVSALTVCAVNSLGSGPDEYDAIYLVG